MNVTTHKDILATQGYDICSPVSGSMKPLIRPGRDCAVFVPTEGRLKKYDVAMYRSGSLNVMHRVLDVKADCYIFRGDYSFIKETVYDVQIIGVMAGFYRDDRYFSVQHPGYRIYSAIWPKCNRLVEWLNPFRIRIWEYLHRRMRRLKQLLARFCRVDIIQNERRENECTKHLRQK